MAFHDGPYLGTEIGSDLDPALPLLDRLLAALARARPDGATAAERDRALTEAFGALSALYAALDPTGGRTSPVVSGHLASLYDACFAAIGSARDAPPQLDLATGLCRTIRRALAGPLTDRT